MIKDLVKLNEALTKELIDWYVGKYNNIIHITSFVKLPDMYILGIIHEFLAIKNVSYFCSRSMVVVWYVNPFLNANNIIKHYNEKGELTDIINTLEFEITFDNILDAHIWSIKYIFEKILIPF
jgi:hypothetical protein